MSTCERCWDTREVRDVEVWLCASCEAAVLADYANRKMIHDRALDAPIECEALEVINAAEIATIERDRQVAEAARAFWGSLQWFRMYLDGFRPQNWPEYDQLARAILHHERPTILAGRVSWRIRLARWLVGL